MKNKLLVYNSLIVLATIVGVFAFDFVKGSLMVAIMLLVTVNLRFLALNLKAKLHRAKRMIQELEKEIRKSNNRQMDLNSLLIGTFLLDLEFYKKNKKSAFNTLWVWQHNNPIAPMIISLLDQSEKQNLVSSYELTSEDQEVLISVINQIKNLTHIEMSVLVLEKFPKLQEYQDNQRIVFSNLVA